MRTDVHQHFWTEPLLEGLARRDELPFVRDERGLSVLYLAGERPYVIDPDGARPELRAATLERDGVDAALICLSSPIGIEGLARAQAAPLLDAYHDGALALGGPFGVWGAIALDEPDPDDVDAVLARGCVGVSLPADALAGVERLGRLSPVLERLEARDAPLFVHPGPGLGRAGLAGCSLSEPLWWPALTRYVTGLQAAWLAFRVAGRGEHPRLRVIFAMLAGLAPLQGERLAARGGPSERRRDPLSFYDTSSYGPQAVAAIREIVGVEQLLYGSDRPVLEPQGSPQALGLGWATIAEGTARALAGAPAMELAR